MFLDFMAFGQSLVTLVPWQQLPPRPTGPLSQSTGLYRSYISFFASMNYRSPFLWTLALSEYQLLETSACVLPFSVAQDLAQDRTYCVEYVEWNGQRTWAGRQERIKEEDNHWLIQQMTMFSKTRVEDDSASCFANSDHLLRHLFFPWCPILSSSSHSSF